VGVAVVDGPRANRPLRRPSSRPEGEPWTDTSDVFAREETRLLERNTAGQQVVGRVRLEPTTEGR